MRKSFRWILLFGFILLLILVSFYALAATNTVPVTSIDDVSTPISQDNLKPKECAGITIGGTNQLLLGTAGNDNISGKQGADCIVGGAGNDTLNGNQGNDVLIGGPGVDVLNGGTGTDTCYGCFGVDTFSSCATQINSCP
jgi:Ca2+-binding RTX toxin-like protein